MTSKQEELVMRDWVERTLADPHPQQARQWEVDITACDTPVDPPRTLLRLSLYGTPAEVGEHVLGIARRRFPHASVSG